MSHGHLHLPVLSPVQSFPVLHCTWLTPGPMHGCHPTHFTLVPQGHKPIERRTGIVLFKPFTPMWHFAPLRCILTHIISLQPFVWTQKQAQGDYNDTTTSQSMHTPGLCRDLPPYHTLCTQKQELV